MMNSVTLPMQKVHESNNMSVGEGTRVEWHEVPAEPTRHRIVERVCFPGDRNKFRVLFDVTSECRHFLGWPSSCSSFPSATLPSGPKARSTTRGERNVFLARQEVIIMRNVFGLKILVPA